MRFKNGIVFCEDGKFRRKDFSVTGELFSDTQCGEEVDLSDRLVIPGLVDTHIHGAGGYDFTSGSAKDLQRMSLFLAKKGTTSFTPTSITTHYETLRNAYKNVYEGEKTDRGARIIGIHMEGPYISEQKKGAHSSLLLKLPDYREFSELNRESRGKIKIVSIAPELEGATSFIRLAKETCVVAAGHTNCSYAEAKNAFCAGVTRLTHLFNAMPPFLHRDTGIIGAAAEDEKIFAELISDGIHVHESGVRAAFKLFPNRIILISDCLSARNGEEVCFLGTERVYLRNGAFFTDECLAGSASTLFDCLRKTISFGVSPEEAITAATKTPAVQLNMYGCIGSISVGRQADFLVCGHDYTLESVYIGGESVRVDV